jgi:hypothetical protein
MRGKPLERNSYGMRSRFFPVTSLLVTCMVLEQTGQWCTEGYTAWVPACAYFDPKVSRKLQPNNIGISHHLHIHPCNGRIRLGTRRRWCLTQAFCARQLKNTCLPNKLLSLCIGNRFRARPESWTSEWQNRMCLEILKYPKLILCARTKTSTLPSQFGPSNSQQVYQHKESIARCIL